MTAATGTEPRARPGHGWRRDAWLLALAALVLRLPALLAGKHLTFDDGQFGATTLALRAGGSPFIDVFSSQGPLHHPLLYAFDLLGFRTLDAPRLLSVSSGIVVTVAAYAIGRRLTSRAGALLAAGLVTTSGSMLFVSGPISADAPALAFTAVAVWLGLLYREQPGATRAIGTGLAMGAGLCVKALVVPTALPVGLLLASHRRARDVALAVGSAVVLFFATALPWGLGRVWDQSVSYHQGSARLHTPLGNLWVIMRTLVERDPFVVAALVGSLVVVVATRRRPEASAPRDTQVDRRSATFLVGGWVLAYVILLAYDPQLWRPHVVQLIVPLALLAALRPAPARALVVMCVLLVPWWYSNVHDIVWPSGYARDQQAVVDRLRRLPDDSLVISDDPGLAWRAGRRPPGNFVDVSVLRVEQHRLTAPKVARAAAAPRVCAVVLWSAARLGSFRSLPESLRSEGYRLVGRWGGARALYERRDC